MDDKQFSGELSTAKAFIEDYLLTRCRIKGKLHTSFKELERFFRNSPHGREQFERHQLEIDTYVRQCSLYGMEYVVDTYKYHIDFQEVEINEECARVTFTTNEIRKYRCTSEMTMVKEIPHSILLVRQRGRWLIEEHLTPMEFVESLRFYGKMTGISDLYAVQKMYLSEVTSMLADRKPYYMKNQESTDQYNREAVVSYALKYALMAEEEPQVGDMDESARFALACLEQGGWDWHMKQQVASERELQKGDLVKISNLTEGVHSMVVTGYIHSLFNKHLITGYLISQHGGYEKNVPLATKPYPREYVHITT